MSDLLQKCAVCHALLDEEDLFCANCGAEAPPSAERQRPAATMTATHNFLCEGCGASMSYDASAQTLRCPFCGSEKLSEQRDQKVIAPQAVLPFRVEQREALELLRKWLGSSFWRPGDLVQAAVVTKLTRVFVPYWVFGGTTYTYWTADTSQTPAGARASWYPVSGHRQGTYTGVLVGASSVLAPEETSALCPFDLRELVPPEQVDLDNVVYEQFRVQRKYARAQAQHGLESLERNACRPAVPGNCRNLKVNVRVEGLTSQPVLLPVWIMAYGYRGQVFRFLVNGQTGRHTGTAPLSYGRVAAVVGGVLAVLLLILLFFGLCSGVAGTFGR